MVGNSQTSGQEAVFFWYDFRSILDCSRVSLFSKHTDIIDSRAASY